MNIEELEQAIKQRAVKTLHCIIPLSPNTLIEILKSVDMNIFINILKIKPGASCEQHDAGWSHAVPLDFAALR
jgi:hypothetical protein